MCVWVKDRGGVRDRGGGGLCLKGMRASVVVATRCFCQIMRACVCALRNPHQINFGLYSLDKNNE